MEPVTTFSRRRAPGQRGIRELVVTMVVAVVAGAVVGLGLVLLDRQLLTPSPIASVDVENVRTLLSALVGGLVTVAVFSLWMRTVVVGLVSDNFSPRTLTTFLEDRFQHRLLGAMVAGIVVVLVLLVGLPTRPGAGAPLAALGAASLIAVTALAGVLGAIQHATRSLAPAELVSRMAARALEVLDRHHTDDDDGRQLLSHRPEMQHARPVRARTSGWVVAVDTERMLELLPPGGALCVRTRVGDFVTPTSEVLLFDPGDAEDELDDERILQCLQLARTRSPELDLAFAIDQLVDVAVHALGGSTDTATAHEALVHLGAVLERVVERGITPTHRLGDEGRHLIDDASWDAADHLQVCVERLRMAAAREPETSRHLLQMLLKVRNMATAVDDRATVSEVGRQTEALLRLADQQEMLERDRRRLSRIARSLLEEPPGSSEEAGPDASAVAPADERV